MDHSWMVKTTVLPSGETAGLLRRLTAQRSCGVRGRLSAPTTVTDNASVRSNAMTRGDFIGRHLCRRPARGNTCRSLLAGDSIMIRPAYRLQAGSYNKLLHLYSNHSGAEYCSVRPETSSSFRSGHGVSCGSARRACAKAATKRAENSSQSTAPTADFSIDPWKSRPCLFRFWAAPAIFAPVAVFTTS